MQRSTVFALVLYVLSLAATTSVCAAWSPSDGAKGQAVFRIRGALVPHDLAGTVGPGWLVGGAAGVGISRWVMLTANFDHVALRDRNARSVEPWTLQLEMGAPFQRHVMPRFEVGAGLYRRTEKPWIFPTSSNPRDETLFGFNYGLGLSAPIATRVMADLNLRYHQTLDRDVGGTRSHSLKLSYVAFGLTYGLR
ncbi:MAG: hypothetical protein E6K71_05215 [Candidatus Eisenbacteria bacterium]|uniref:Uncharacterized protein n=1 Tax=Eiseniibacteriota bacterium TaxID=2212470 RepID=A0A538SCW6_UNCEI|nr:MAG: hypothetical protein E6K71_05215 [Candidatus Eisenbacteria bacterium]